MVKNEELRPTSAFTREIARKVRGLVAERGITQKQIAKELQRTQSYVSMRMQGRTGWDTAELDAIAGLLDSPCAAGSMAAQTYLAERLRREAAPERDAYWRGRDPDPQLPKHLR